MPNHDPLAAAWSSSEADRFDWRCWDGEGVVYVLASGQTHELGATASGVLSVLLEKAGQRLTESDLLAALDDGDAVDEDAEAEQAATQQELHTLRELLSRMAKMGLVDRHTLSA